MHADVNNISELAGPTDRSNETTDYAIASNIIDRASTTPAGGGEGGLRE